MDSLPSLFRPPETPTEPMEFLSRSWSISAHEISKSIAPSQPSLKNIFGGPSNAAIYLAGDGGPISDGNAGELAGAASVSGNPFSFSSSDTSQLIMERIMSQAQDASPRTSGRLSHSSGGPLTDSSPASPSDMDDGHKLYCRLNNLQMNYNHQYRSNSATPKVAVHGGCKTVGRWFKDRKEKKKEEARAHNAQLHAAVSVAGVAAAVAAVAAAAAASTSASCKDEQTVKTNMAVASAATLVAAQCVEAAESMGAEREQVAAVVSSAVNVRSAGDIMTLTAAAATALRGAATLRARACKEDVWNVAAAVIPMEKGFGGNGGCSSSSSGELNSTGHHHLLPLPDDNFLGICSRELVSRGGELLKRTRKGELHWKIVSVYINRMSQVTLKTKSRHVAGTITKKKKNVVLEVLRDLPAWPGRHLIDGGENFRYFGLRTASGRVVEFECRDQRECDVWTQGVSRLLTFAAERRKGGIVGHARY